MFMLLGIIVGLYTTFAACTGNVYAKRGPGAAVIERSESPGYFWIVIGCYSALAIAMMTIF
jgi:hypothetical protein